MLRAFDTTVIVARCARAIPALVVAAALVAASGCGIKGPLRPATSPAPATAPAPPEATPPTPTTEQDPATPRKP